MPLTLIEIKSLIGALGVKIPEDILQQKAKAEEFEERRKKVVGEAGSKASEWHLRANYDAALNAADEAVGKKQFDPALKHLDECDRLLQQPELAPEVVAALKQLEERKKASEAEIARVKALESPIGNDLKGVLEAASLALKDFDAPTADKRVAEIEQMIKAYAHQKAAAEAAATKAKVIEQAKLKAKIDELKKRLDSGVAEIKKVVDSIQETTLRQPQADALQKLSDKVSAALKLDSLANQETELTALSKDIAPLKSAAENAAKESTTLIAARNRVAELKKQAEKALAEADAAVKAIGEPTLATPEAQKLEALTKRQLAAAGVTDLAQQEKEFSALLVDLGQLKKDAAAAKVKADELKAAKLRVTQKMGVVDAALTDLQKVVDGLQEKLFKDSLSPRITPLTQERTRIGTLTVPGDQEAALVKLEKDVATVKKDADNRAAWDKWLKDTWDAWANAAKDWIGVLKEQAAKNALQAQFDAVVQEKGNFLTNDRLGDIEKTSYPKIEKVYETANRISDHGPEVDMEIHKLRSLVVAIMKQIGKATVTNPIAGDFDVLANEKKQSWPAGNTAAAMLTAMDNFDARIKTLRDRAEAARGDFIGGDMTYRAEQIQKMKDVMDEIDRKLTDCEDMDWKKIKKLPPQESAPLLKMKTEFEAARNTYKALDTRLKKMLPWAKKMVSSGQRALGKDALGLGKEITALLEQVLKRFMKMTLKTKGPDDLDKVMEAMPDHVDDPNQIAACKAAIEARFGIKIEIGQDFNAKSLPRIGKMLARVPEWQSKQSKKTPDGSATEKSLKTLSYETEPLEKGNYYSGNRKMIALQGMTEKGGPNDEHTVVADSGQAVKTSYFDFTTLHEVGHAVDDRIKFMSSRMEKDGFGKWKKETFDSVLNSFLPSLVTDCTGGTKKAQAEDLKAMLTDLIKTGDCAKPANATAKLGSLFTEWDQIQNHAVIAKCRQGIYTKAEPWNKGKAHADSVVLNGRVYQEAYDNDWFSYAHADRATTGVTKYQWRAPGEWFAEIYALFYLNKLSGSHPMSNWFTTAAKSEQEAMKA
jgi:hypothetical protein